MIIPGRFNGPPDSGNGGYTAGLVAGRLTVATDPGSVPAETGPTGGAAEAGAAEAGADGVEVTLRVPPPLDIELAVTATDDGIAVSHGDTLVATAKPAAVTETVPPVPYQDAVRVSESYPGFTSHPFPTCYTCGPERPDGLRVFPGRLSEGRTAAPFVVPEDVTPATVWAALDCPGGWTVGVEARPYVLGRIAARIDRMPEPGIVCVVTGRLIRAEGRKAYVATTLWPADGGEPYATARAIWIALR